MSEAMSNNVYFETKKEWKLSYSGNNSTVMILIREYVRTKAVQNGLKYFVKIYKPASKMEMNKNK